MNGPNWQEGWNPFQEFHREMGRLFESLDPFQSARHIRQFPAINVYLAEEGYLLSAQLPGLSADEVELTVTSETLSLRGERKRPEGVKDDSYRRQERVMGRWARTVTLPDRIDESRVSAHFADGILTVRLPRAESAKPRHIAVSSPS
ncbi:MAG: Hsp20/alpha crystallin family protein [Paludisphaera borealis]|uniref:Hsp20/alpha crystallin family protein n=1 Tax=Paludisphaera borealis TaxID=1387353 RepID=UPI002843251C|nr:Hsp20/alpha crystallin family protein [Paludisphaera borealis]MDR3621849.1 Hsp20/alpha crystallin family protein [Paludisphaera borealis]